MKLIDKYSKKLAEQIALLLKYRLIADKKDFIAPKTDPNDYSKCFDYEDVVDLFCSYNVLMPLIFDINNSNNPDVALNKYMLFLQIFRGFIKWL